MTSVNWLPVIYIPGKERLAQLVPRNYVLFLRNAKPLAYSTRDLARQLIKLMRTVHLQTRCRDNPNAFIGVGFLRKCLFGLASASSGVTL